VRVGIAIARCPAPPWGGGHGAGVLHGGEDAQPATTAGTSEDLDLEHAAHQGSPGPRARGAGGTGAGVELARGGLRARAAVADNL